MIIPVFNRIENIKKVLSCLARQKIQPQHTVKIILVDDGSDDGLGEWITARNLTLNITYIKCPREHDWNASKPRNKGARLADVDTDCYYFLDSDILLPPNRIQRLIDDYEINVDDYGVAKDPNRVIIGPYHYMSKEITIDGNWWEQYITDYQQDGRWKSFEEHPVQEKNQGVGFALACFGGSLLIPRSLFFKAGCYDEFCTSGTEDGEFGLTLWETGAVFSMDKELLGWHHPHEKLPAREDRIPEMIEYIDKKHTMDLVKASGEAYRQWGINWVVPDVWK